MVTRGREKWLRRQRRWQRADPWLLWLPVAVGAAWAVFEVWELVASLA